MRRNPKSLARSDAKLPPEKSSGASTGIYRQVTVRLARKGEKRGKGSLPSREFWRRMDLAFPGIHTELDNLEKAAQAIIKAEGGTIGLWKKKLADGSIKHEWFHLPEGARPVASRARKLIFDIWAARHYLREGNIEAVAWATLTVGRIAEMVRVSWAEPAVVRDAKVRAGQREGGRKRAEKYRGKYAAMQIAVDSMASRNRALTKTEISRRVGKELGFSDRTVRNHTRDPRKKIGI